MKLHSLPYSYENEQNLIIQKHITTLLSVNTAQRPQPVNPIQLHMNCCNSPSATNFALHTVLITFSETCPMAVVCSLIAADIQCKLNSRAVLLSQNGCRMPVLWTGILAIQVGVRVNRSEGRELCKGQVSTQSSGVADEVTMTFPALVSPCIEFALSLCGWDNLMWLVTNCSRVKQILPTRITRVSWPVKTSWTN